MDIISPILFYVLTQFGFPFADKSAAKIAQLASQQISLEKRHANPYVNRIFKDNILLNMAYLAGKVTKKEEINWREIQKSISYKFTLLPDETFAYHEDVSEKYKNSVVKTTNANFNLADGFISDGYLTGDGVCHLASLIYWVARNAGLDSYAPANHDFTPIPGIEKEFGVSIFKSPGQNSANSRQNLYVTNNRKNPVIFEFDYRNSELKLSIFEVLESSL